MPRISKNIEHADTDTSAIGRFGESFASDYLLVRGYTIVATNFKAVIGRNRKGVPLTGEIDIIALKDGLLCFVEVKTRNLPQVLPESAVTLRKQRQIARTAAAYARAFNIPSTPRRFDVITVIPQDKKAPALRHLKRFWSPERFRKRRWSGDSTYIS